MPKVREASFDDYQHIKALQNRYGLEAKGYEEWQHLWKSNPVITDIKDPWPMGWVLENDAGQVVGYLGNIPTAYELEDRRLIAATITSFVVDIDYRNHSLLLLNRFFTQKCADIFLNTTANYEAEKIFSAFKAQKVPADLYDISLFWIINYWKFISCVFSKKAMLFIRKALSLGDIIRFPLTLATGGINKLIKKNKGINRLDSEMQYCATFDERFDVFWDNFKKRYHNRLLGVRSKKYLDWHFKYAIADKKIWIFVVERNSRITDYAIFLRQDNLKFGLKRIRLVDLQSIDNNPDIIMGMISSGIKICHKEKVDVLEVIGFNSQKRSIIEKCRPHKIRLPGWPFFYKAKDESLAKELNNPEAWDPCLFDGDASL